MERRRDVREKQMRVREERKEGRKGRVFTLRVEISATSGPKQAKTRNGLV